MWYNQPMQFQIINLFKWKLQKGTSQTSNNQRLKKVKVKGNKMRSTSMKLTNWKTMESTWLISINSRLQESALYLQYSWGNFHLDDRMVIVQKKKWWTSKASLTRSARKSTRLQTRLSRWGTKQDSTFLRRGRKSRKFQQVLVLLTCFFVNTLLKLIAARRRNWKYVYHRGIWGVQNWEDSIVTYSLCDCPAGQARRRWQWQSALHWHWKHFVNYLYPYKLSRPERIKQISAKFGLDAEGVLGNIMVGRAFTVDSVNTLIMQAAAAMIEDQFALLIIDSIMAPFRVDFSGRGELAERQQMLGKLLNKIQKISE